MYLYSGRKKIEGQSAAGDERCVSAILLTCVVMCIAAFAVSMAYCKTATIAFYAENNKVTQH